MDNFAPIITEIIKKGAFTFLGNENIITNMSDFGEIWENFFKKGGYDPILPYTEDTNPINVIFYNENGENIYMQGFFVKNVEKVPMGYSLRFFPESEYLMVTTEWLDDLNSCVGYEGNVRCNEYALIVEAPDGYERYDTEDAPICRIEKEVGPPMKEKYRYEVWVPIRKKQ